MPAQAGRSGERVRRMCGRRAEASGGGAGPGGTARRGRVATLTRASLSAILMSMMRFAMMAHSERHCAQSAASPRTCRGAKQPRQ